MYAFPLLKQECHGLIEHGEAASVNMNTASAWNSRFRSENRGTEQFDEY